MSEERSAGTSTYLSTASAVPRAPPWRTATASRCCPRSQEGEMTELLLGTKKGLFVLQGDPAGGFEITARAFAGEPVDYAVRDPRSGRLLATMTSPFYGPKVFFSDDDGGDWQEAEGVALPED